MGAMEQRPLPESALELSVAEPRLELVPALEDPETEAIATIGAKEGMAHLALAVLQPGDGALVPSPTYPIHSYSVVIADGDLRSVPLVETTVSSSN